MSPSDLEMILYVTQQIGKHKIRCIGKYRGYFYTKKVNGNWNHEFEYCIFNPKKPEGHRVMRWRYSMKDVKAYIDYKENQNE